MLNLEKYRTRTITVTDADGAQTDQVIGEAVAPDQRFEVAELYVAGSTGIATPPQVRIGFGTANTPAAALATGALGLLLHAQVGAGLQYTGAMGLGAKDQELRYTCEDPVGGFITITVLYRIYPAG